MMTRVKWLIYLTLSFFFSITLSAQNTTYKPIDVQISTLMAMQMVGSSNVNFEIPANSHKQTIEKADAIHIKVQTNRNWVLQVKPLEASLSGGSIHNNKIPTEALKIRANGNAFTNLDHNGVDLIKGNKGSYQSTGNDISIDYELSYKGHEAASSYQVTLVFTLAAI